MDGRRPARGFTLVELLVTLAIITIMVSIGIPMYGQFTRQSAVSPASSELIAALNEARSRAVAERHVIQLSRLGTGTAGDWSQGWQSQRLVSGVLQPDILMLNERRNRSNGVTVTEASSNNSFTFDREGRAGTTYTFTINDSQGCKARTIQVSPFGRVALTTFTCP